MVDHLPLAVLEAVDVRHAMLELDRLSGELGASTLDAGLARQVRARIDPPVDEFHVAVGHRPRGLLERVAHRFPADLLSTHGVHRCDVIAVGPDLRQGRDVHAVQARVELVRYRSDIIFRGHDLSSCRQQRGSALPEMSTDPRPRSRTAAPQSVHGL